MLSNRHVADPMLDDEALATSGKYMFMVRGGSLAMSVNVYLNLAFFAWRPRIYGLYMTVPQTPVFLVYNLGFTPLFKKGPGFRSAAR